MDPSENESPPDPAVPPDNPSVPSSEVGLEGLGHHEEAKKNKEPASGETTAVRVLSGMESLLSRLLESNRANLDTTPRYSAPQLIKYDPDDSESDIEGWCRITEVIVNSRKLEGPELLLALTHALKGRAATCLTRLNTTDIKWPVIKDTLLARFSKPKLMQDYFDDVTKFQISNKETASEAALRLWNLIERIPDIEMKENAITGFAISILTQRDPVIRRELNSHTITTRAQLCRVLKGVNLRKRFEDTDENEVESKRPRFTNSRFEGSCRYCGNRGHKMEDCRKRREHDDRTHPKPVKPEKPVTCFTCGQPGHLSTTCPSKKTGNEQPIRKEVHLCECKLQRSSLSTSSGETVSFSFDNGSACSLVRRSVVEKIAGTVHHDLVVLTGIGGGTVECSTQILSPVKIDGIDVSILFHVVDDDVVPDEILIGRDILSQGIHAGMLCNSVKFTELKEVNACEVNDKIDFNLVDTDLVGKEKDALISILKKYSDFFIEGVPTRRVNTGEMKIDPIDPHKIVQRRPYRLSPTEKEIVKEKVKSLLDAGVIRESTSPFASPILLVKKKDGTDRMCVDFRELNANTRPEHYPLPRIDEQIDRLNGAHFFSSLDMASGYHQILVEPNSVERTAFVTPEGQYEYLAMPFGLRNSASVYQRCINKALKSLKDTVALAYMDDVLCFSKDVAEGLQRLDLVLAALSEAGFSFNIYKCKFMKTEISYLGYVIRAGEVRPNPQKVQALIDAPPPKTATQVRQFLGLASYFRRFIPNFVHVASPLYPLTKLKGPITWTQKHNDAHKAIVKILTSEPVLTIFDPSLPCELHTDASSEGYGAVLIQRKENMPHVIGYFSRRTTEIESRYHSYELETLAVVRAVENYRHYLYGQHFTVVSDCNSLKASKSKTDLSPRVHRWWAYLQAYDFDIIYNEGKSMAHADFLSRNPLPTESPAECIDSEQTVCHKDVRFVELHNSWLKVEQMRDSEIQDLVHKHENGELPEAIAHTYDVRDGVLYRKIERNKLSSWLPMVPRSLIWTLINQVHTELMHLGPEKTLEKLYEQYWFPQMAKNVRKFIDSCIVCKASKGASGPQQVRMHPIPKSDIPWETIHIDLTGKLSGKSDRKEYVSVIIDGFTKYTLLEYTQSLDATCAVKALKKAVSLFGAPKRIVADQGRCYISAEFKQFCADHNIQLHLIATGTSRANGQVERVMRTLKSLLTIIENDSSKVWRDELDNVQLALNSSRSRVTGYTPTELMLGIRANSLGLAKIAPDTSASVTPLRANLEAIRQEASSNIEKEASIQKGRFDQGRAKVKPFSEGDYVFLKCSERNQTKLAPKFKGPFVVVRVLDNDRYELKTIQKSNRVYKYSHENLRAVPRGLEGLVQVATSLAESEEAETAVNAEETIELSDDDSETLSASACASTLTADSEYSDTLSATSENRDYEIIVHQAQVHENLNGGKH